jgi:predicted nucleic acid-binding protein
MILDTNAVSAILAGDESIKAILKTVWSLVIPAIVVGECRYGIAMSRKQSELDFYHTTGTS